MGQSTLTNTRTFFQAQTHVVTDIYSNTDPMKPLRFPAVFNGSGSGWEGDMERQFFQLLSIVGFGYLPVKQEGQTASIDAASEGTLQFFPYVSYALRYIVTKEMGREDARKIIPMLPRLLKYSSYQTQEVNFWNILNLSFLNAASGGYNVNDGLALCSNVHTCAGAPGITWSNYLGAVSLTVETINQAFNLMLSMPDDRGLQTSRTPVQLVYPIFLHQTATEVMSSYYYPSTDENRVNVVAGTLQPCASEYLTAPANGPYPWWVTSGKGMPGTDAHTMFATTKWDEQRAFYQEDTQSLNHETEFRSAWGAANGRGVVGSQGA